ncbi:WD-40 repeat-containing protein MSI1-like [Vicia villosa]|uniref:WD-40 repeat-containing protein MSI1-like n=1 Tax=Vicia villosa TaxID=3911 RepID=UPI00273ACFFD|nr:WD-40 repeat-containing protein MSI1-like [Vicia villosa]
MDRNNGKVNFTTRNYVAARASNCVTHGGDIDFVITQKFEGLSYTFQWFPTCNESEDENYSVQKVIFGNHDDEYDRNYLMIAEVQIPHKYSDSDYSSNNDCPNYNDVNDGIIFKIIKEINHDGDVNIVRYMPKKDSIIASKTNGPEVYIFDIDKQPSKASDDRARPELRLHGHKTNGYGLSWSKFNSGHLLSGDYDGNICIWDVNATSNNLTLDPLRVFKVNEGDIEDIAWNPKNENLFGSVGKKNLHLWDVRAPIVNNPVQYYNAHSETVNCLSFNPFKEWSVVTGSNDESIKLWDTRKIAKSNDMHQCVQTFKQVDGCVFQVDWNPNNETMFASGCHLGRVFVWDVSKIDDKQNNMDIDDGPALLFVHHEHLGEVSDLSWNPCEDMMIASVDVGNSIHLWKMY